MTDLPSYNIPAEDLTSSRDRLAIMLQHMLAMQDKSNKSLFSDWQKRGLGWDTAILVESAELIDHLSWKWWKAGSTDLEQAQMEVVDIWHFLLSQLILHEPALLYNSKSEVPEGQMATYFRAQCTILNMSARIMRSPEVSAVVDKEKLIADVKRFLAFVLSEAYPPVDTFYHFLPVVSHSGLSFYDLYLKYIGKNILNNFRWANGYREGTYVKDWLGQEDNQYLTELMGSTDEVGEGLQEYIEKGLESRYKEVLDSART
jgi:hypothetical protein